MKIRRDEQTAPTMTATTAVISRNLRRPACPRLHATEARARWRKYAHRPHGPTAIVAMNDRALPAVVRRRQVRHLRALDRRGRSRVRPGRTVAVRARRRAGPRGRVRAIALCRVVPELARHRRAVRCSGTTPRPTATCPTTSSCAQFLAGHRGWNPDEWADLFARAGARYVVLVTKHHDGVLLWPSAHRNPHKQGWQSERDIVGELAAAVRDRGMRFGTYYSGGLDWTFGGLPITDFALDARRHPAERRVPRRTRTPTGAS